MDDLFILVHIKKLLVLIDDNFMCRIDCLAYFRLLCALIHKNVLHEAGEDLCELNFGALRRFLCRQLLLNEPTVQWPIEKSERVLPVELGKILQCKGHILPLVVLRGEAILGPREPRFKKVEQRLRELVVVGHFDQRGYPKAVDEENAADILFANEPLRSQHLLQLDV